MKHLLWAILLAPSIANANLSGSITSSQASSTSTSSGGGGTLNSITVDTTAFNGNGTASSKLSLVPSTGVVYVPLNSGGPGVRYSSGLAASTMTAQSLQLFNNSVNPDTFPVVGSGVPLFAKNNALWAVFDGVTPVQITTGPTAFTLGFGSTSIRAAQNGIGTTLTTVIGSTVNVKVGRTGDPIVICYGFTYDDNAATGWADVFDFSIDGSTVGGGSNGGVATGGDSAAGGNVFVGGCVPSTAQVAGVHTVYMQARNAAASTLDLKCGTSNCYITVFEAGSLTGAAGPAGPAGAAGASGSTGNTTFAASSATFTQLDLSTTNATVPGLSVSTSNQAQGQLGMSTGTARVAFGNLCYFSSSTVGVSSSTQGNGTAEVSFATCTIPANILSVPGDCIWFTATVRNEATTNAKTLKIRYGSVPGTGAAAIVSGQASSSNQTMGVYNGRICKDAKGVQSAWGSGFNGNGSNSGANAGTGTLVTALDETKTTFLTYTLQSGVQQGDMQFDSFSAMFQPGPIGGPSQ